MSIRTWLCDLFNCESFKNLETKVDTIVSGVGDALAGIINMKEKQGEILTAVNEITVAPDPEVLERLGSIEGSLFKLLKPPLSIWGDNVGGETGDTITIPIYIKGEQLRQIETFGLTCYFESDKFTFLGVLAGELTSDWMNVAGNEATPGQITIGGMMGTGKPIKGERIGRLFDMRFTVTGSSDAMFTLTDYVDDLAEMIPAPQEVYFTYGQP